MALQLIEYGFLPLLIRGISIHLPPHYARRVSFQETISDSLLHCLLSLSAPGLMPREDRVLLLALIILKKGVA